MQHQTVVILDFGGRNNQLIARRVRDCGVYCEVYPYNTPAAKLEGAKGIIFTGGKPGEARLPDEAVWSMGIPLLGIGYGAAMIAAHFGGTTAEIQPVREVKNTAYEPKCALFRCCVSGDSAVSLLSDSGPCMEALYYCANRIETLPEGFGVSGTAEGFPVAAFGCAAKKMYGTLFSPEYPATQGGTDVLKGFLFQVCGLASDWNMEKFAEDAIAAVREQVGDGHLLLGLSGGVDSSVCAALLSKAVGKQLTCIFVDTGLMWKNEGDEVIHAFDGMELQLVRVDAEARFLAKLKGVTEPERKRKIIGEEFIRVFEEEARKVGTVDFLAQGTIYPDIIESGVGDAGMVKSHHNVGGLPERIEFKGLCEPLRYLFKDEVRKLAAVLGLPDYLANRQPFPGPGLGVRCIGECNKEKLDLLRDVDAIYRSEIDKAGLNKEISQYFVVLTDTRSTGVRGDERRYGYTVALRAVRTNDFMTAEWVRVPYEVLDNAATRIVTECTAVNRVVFDITPKPPATIEWE